MDELINRTLGHYHIIEPIGQGGMATVYKAYQSSLDRHVALKVLSPFYAKQLDLGERFRREARAVAALNHPNILPIFDFGQEEQYSFISMRLIEGAHTLKSRMTATPDLSHTAALVGQIAAALDHAHQQAIIHRDVKPSNVLMDGSWVLLSDFGLAKMTKEAAQLTPVGLTIGMGTPSYMSPEQGRGLDVDHRTDIYALGVMLYEMLTGEIPQNAETPIKIILKRVTEPLPSPRTLNPHIPEAVEQVVIKALALDPQERFATAGDMAEALKRAMGGGATQNPPAIAPNSIPIRPTSADAPTNPSPSRLRLTCFQNFQATLDGQVLTDFRSAKGRALLIYLAVEHQRPHQREKLAGLFWPDEAEAKARRNLSQTLLELRQTIGDRQVSPPFFKISRQTIDFNPEGNVWLDVTLFQTHFALVQSHAHPPGEECESCIQALKEALALYRGPFLANFSIAASDLFETWLVTTRETLHQLALAGLVTLSNHYEYQRDHTQARHYVQRQLDLAPWQEEVHCQMMRLLAISGQRSAALAQYESCKRVLASELDVTPTEATIKLAEQIRIGQVGPESTMPALPPLPPPFQPPAAPPHFAGRERELDLLQAGLTLGGSRMYAIVGMGGVGKTTISSVLAQRLRNEFGDGVLWANLANSTPLDILGVWSQAYGYDFSGIADLDSRAAAMRGLLAEKRVLLILDNVAGITEVKPLLPGSNSCAVILTTRNLDTAHALNAEVLQLNELSATHSRQVLAQILGEERLIADEAAAQKICTLLHHLPLAIEIAAQRLRARPRQALARMATWLSEAQHRLGLEIADQAVRTSFEVSWQALDADLKQIFSLVALFEGRAFSVSAIAYLVNIDHDQAEDHCLTLASLSLLQERLDTHYQQHPLLADFAREKLLKNTVGYNTGNAGNRDTLAGRAALYSRLADFYYIFAQENSHSFAALQLEWENLIVAIEAAYEQQRWQLVMAFGDQLTEAWFSQGRFGEARRVYEWIDAATIILDDKQQQALNLARWGRACLEQGHFVEAARRLGQSLILYRQVSDTAGVAEVQFALARVDIEQGRYDEAKAWLLESLTLKAQLGDIRGVAAVMFRQARIYYVLKALDEAKRVAQEALGLQEEIEDQTGRLLTLRLLALICGKLKDFSAAQTYGEQARRLSETLQDQRRTGSYALRPNLS